MPGSAANDAFEMKARGHAYRTAPRSGLEPTSVTAVAFARKHHRAALFAFFVGELDGAALFALVGELDGAALFALVGELDGAPIFALFRQRNPASASVL